MYVSGSMAGLVFIILVMTVVSLGSLRSQEASFPLLFLQIGSHSNRSGDGTGIGESPVLKELFIACSACFG